MRVTLGPVLAQKLFDLPLLKPLYITWIENSTRNERQKTRHQHLCVIWQLERLLGHRQLLSSAGSNSTSLIEIDVGYNLPERFCCYLLVNRAETEEPAARFKRNEPCDSSQLVKIETGDNLAALFSVGD